ncbi:pseudaminic acid cytidylyltransferase [Nonlabens sp. Asnod3-A02]|uniref:pseudaminic acid cytidylyltransferase n=1 Tax=Nonlabens sp. Asnod3-A02 TaxID=3160579 RepID=UPI0038635BB3
MRNLCIIPARGGSKRIPRKNIKPFLGKPIIAYSIEVALKSNLFDVVMVSTDDEEIKNISLEYGAQVPFLREETNSNDFATLSDVVEEVKSSYLLKEQCFDNICCLLPTAPLVNTKIIKDGLNLLIEEDVDSTRPVVRYSYPIQRALILDEKNKMSFLNNENAKIRSQDLSPTFHDAGMFYWMNFDKGLKGTNKYAFEIPEILAQDIDTFEDWQYAELKFKFLNK